MGKLFGTDGIRGAANEYPMTPEMAVQIGRAAAFYFKGNKRNPKIVVGKDTRISGDMFENAIVSGICSIGADAGLAGILPTPGVAFVTGSTDASAGIVISASHNPFYDNGIKIFNEDGYKLTDNVEAEIEQLILERDLASECTSIRDTGRAYHIKDSEKAYVGFLKDTLPKTCSFKGLKILLDCSNGATYHIASELFLNLGAKIESIGVSPDGKNINQGCGSEHPEELIKKVIAVEADIGLAFDGDGDRLIAVDEKGQIVSGDQMLAIFAKVMKQKKLLVNNILVTTVMSNMGLGVALKGMDITHEKSDVGDRYVLEKMRSTGAVLGGEDSGHMIFLNHHTTGDGLLAALKLVETMTESSKPLSELSKVMTVFPQVLVNVEVKQKPELDSVPEIKRCIQSMEETLGEKGRVLVRYSGTQPICRVMVEGPDFDETNRCCRQIADIIRKQIG